MIDGKNFRLAGRDIVVPGVTLAQLDTFKSRTRKEAKAADEKRKQRDALQQEILSASMKLIPGFKLKDFEKKKQADVERLIMSKIEASDLPIENFKSLQDQTSILNALEEEIMREVNDRVDALKRDICVAAISRNYPGYTLEEFLNEAQAADVDAIAGYATHGHSWEDAMGKA